VGSIPAVPTKLLSVKDLYPEFDEGVRHRVFILSGVEGQFPTPRPIFSNSSHLPIDTHLLLMKYLFQTE